MSAGFHVVPEALVAFAERCEGYGDEMLNLSTALDDAAIGRDAFGHIPGVAERIYTAYDEHVEECKEAAASAATVLTGVGLNVALSAANYETTDENNTAG